MSFYVESFVHDPSIRVLSSLKRIELTQVAKHYELIVTSSMKKGEVRQLIIDHLCKEELASDDEGDVTENSTVSLKKLELQERAKKGKLRSSLKNCNCGKKVRDATDIKRIRIITGALLL